MSVNKVILIGNLGKDPEIRYSQSGTAVANFSIATNRNVKKNDEWVKESEWHKIVAFGNTEAFVIGENVEVRRSPQAVACKKRYAVELGKPRCAPDVDNHEPGGSS